MQAAAKDESSGSLSSVRGHIQLCWLKHDLLISRLLVGALALICYLGSVRGEFVFDDSEAVLGNQDVNPATPLSRVFSDDFWGKQITDKTSHKSYRPLTVLTFRWNYWLAGGLEPFGFHLTNVILHVVVSVLYLEVCYCLARDWEHWTCAADRDKRRGRPMWPSLAALLFAVHPIHTESVAGVVGRAELTSALCFFLAFLSYLKSCKAGSSDKLFPSVMWMILTSLLSGCAMLFKEQGITVVGVCVVYDAVVYGSLEPLHPRTSLRQLYHRKGIILRVALILASSGILLWGRYHLMATGPPKFMDIDNPASFADSLWTRVLSYSYIYSLNAWLLLNPWWLCFDWSMGCVPLVESLSEWRVVAIVTFWCGIGTLVAYAIFGRSSQLKRLVTVSLAFLIIPFLPASNVFFAVGFVVAERVLYLPSAGYCLLVALGTKTLASHWRKLQSVIIVPVFVLLLLFIGRSLQRSEEWLTEETLFTSAVAVCPLNAKVHYNIGKVYSDRGHEADAESAYREAIRLYPEYAQALNNLGNILKESSRPHEAEDNFHRALKANPEFAAAWMNLGIVQASLNKTEEAEESYQKAILHRKKYPDAYYNLGNLYIDVGRHSDAIAAFKTAIELQRAHSNAWNNLGKLYENLELYSEAESTMEEAIKAMPSNPQCYFSLGVMLGRLQRLQEAEELLRTAISMNSAPNYHANLGVVYHLQKDYDRAETEYQLALAADPSLDIAKDNLRKLMATKRKKQHGHAT